MPMKRISYPTVLWLANTMTAIREKYLSEYPDVQVSYDTEQLKIVAYPTWADHTQETNQLSWSLAEISKVTIPEKEYERLKKDSLFLSALESAGVDNWSGYSHAFSFLDGEDDE